ncbi:hypothetical protein TrVFT333_001396 [Trichoderma virens FT-333]|nr:hypothetical protein TrVFT333_001396 [Trichoderma virens FT-333]
MGLIRDAIGSALGANQLNNGLSSRPRLAFGSDSSRNGRRLSVSSKDQSSSYSQGYPDYANRRENRRRSSDGNENDVYKNGSRYGAEQYSDRQYRSSIVRYPSDRMQHTRDGYASQLPQSPPGYETYPGDGRGYQWQPYDGEPSTDAYYTDDRGFSRAANFRPLALPQIAYGDGQPFLRGYSQELRRYNITMEDFIQVVDSINIAIIPNPENQIFQKGANIAGWFVPGAAGIGLMVGQIGVGLGAAAGHASQLSSALGNANMNLFLPNGLELCIGGSANVDAEVGISQGSAQPYSINVSPEERVACYGDLIAPISQILPPLQQSGRNDPIAMLGRGLASRDSQKKMEKAQKDMKKGKNKNVNNLEGASSGKTSQRGGTITLGDTSTVENFVYGSDRQDIFNGC